MERTLNVFIDTSAFYANAVAEDANHERARTLLATLGEEKLATSNYVLLETVALIQRRHGLEAAELHGRLIMESTRMLWVDDDAHAGAWRLWRSKRLRGLSLVDCTSFVLMRREGIRKALAFDGHFAQQGFVLPR